MKVRPYKREDTAAIMQLFHDTVHEVNSRDYSQAQIEAWAPATMDAEAWVERLSSCFTYVAEAEDKIIGFGELKANAYRTDLTSL